MINPRRALKKFKQLKKITKIANKIITVAGTNGKGSTVSFLESILTEKKVRRVWNMDEVASAFKMKAYDISDSPLDIDKHLKDYNFEFCYKINLFLYHILYR